MPKPAASVSVLRLVIDNNSPLPEALYRGFVPVAPELLKVSPLWSSSAVCEPLGPSRLFSVVLSFGAHRHRELPKARSPYLDLDTLE